MLPHSDYVHYEQFDVILVTTNTTVTVYEQRNSSPLLPCRSTHSTHRQQRTLLLCGDIPAGIHDACMPIYKSKPARISGMAQTPQTGFLTVARGSLRRGPCCSRVVLHEARVIFECVRTFFFVAKKSSGYIF